jgi:YD repeat-containing protein
MEQTEASRLAFYSRSPSAFRDREAILGGDSPTVRPCARPRRLLAWLRRTAFLLLVLLAVQVTSQAAPPNFTFSVSKMGNALIDGGWSIDYTIAQVNASPEFSFPLQLVYLSTRDGKGLFGSQWFCPQLESTIVPKGPGILLWTDPSGGQAAFVSKPNRPLEFTSMDGKWSASQVGVNYNISNPEGWRFSYVRGRLDSVTSPSGRALQFLGAGTPAQSVLIRDPSSGNNKVIATLGGNPDNCTAVLQVNGQNHQFSYIKDIVDNRLTAWIPPVGNSLRFVYPADSGALARIESVSGQKVEDSIDFRTMYVPPADGGQSSPNHNPRHDPANYWLQGDSLYDYSFAPDKKHQGRLLADQVAAKSKTGLTLELSQSSKRGMITSKEGDVVTTTYFYKAPGQKYDGKLRRVEKDGKLQIEYRYDRKTGVVSESIDANGISTYFEYPETWAPSRAPLSEPKPIRVLRGTAAKKELVAEYGYNDLGQVAVTKDAAGQITRYSYTPRGEIQSVNAPDGSTTTFNYDSLGRRTSVMRGKLKESVEYNDAGRVTSSTSADGIKTDYAFTKQGLPATISRGGKLVTEFLYDPQGKLLGQKDALGRIRKIERDPKGNLLSETAPNGSTTRYEYDQFGRRIAQIDGNGNRISFSYDPAGHLVRQVNPLGQTLTWTYDAKGHLTQRSNGVQTITSTYDPNDRLIRIDYGAGQTVSYDYDKEGHLLSAITPESRSDYFNEQGNRISAEHRKQGNNEILLRYRYNVRGQRTGLMLSAFVPLVPSSGALVGKEAHYEPIQQTEYTYDQDGRLASIISDGQTIITYQYDAAGRPIQKAFGNGITASVSYDSQGRLTGTTFSGGPITTPLSLNYQWDAASQLTARTWNGETLAYSYDPSGQLLKVTETTGNTPRETYSYDKAGNMTFREISGVKTYMSYDSGNQLIQTSTSPDHPTNSASMETRPAPALHRSVSLVASSAIRSDRDGITEPVTRPISAMGLPRGALAGEDEPSRGIRCAEVLTPFGVREVSDTDSASSIPHSSPSPESPVSTPTPQSPPPPTPVTGYSYDKAGRLISSPDGLTRTYGWLDKVISLASPAGTTSYSYWPDGQLAAKKSPTASETFLWDGLALIRRNDTIYIIEPHPSGGVPIASHPVGKPDELTYYLNDMLGTTLATVEKGTTRFATLTSYGQPMKAPINAAGAASASPGLGSGASSVPANPAPSTPSFPTKQQ